jgi:peptidoglycan/LPS O-acetylase OafA/YrhL
MTDMLKSTSPRGSNSYDFIRFVAASMVLYSHHHALMGRPEPIVPFYGEKFGALAVYIFFSLSGFLIYLSLEKNGDWWRFAAARFLRVMPNLTVALVLSSLVTLLYFSNFANLPAHIYYVVRGILLALFGAGYDIPGIFESLKYHALNGPLWSLRYELHLYLFLFLIVTVGGRFRGWILAILLPLLIYNWMADKHQYILGVDIFEYSRLGQIFFSGALLGYLWKYWKQHAIAVGLAGLVLCFVLEALIPFNSFLNALALAAAVIGLGSSSALAWFSKGGDSSYGMYIYAWPVQQFCILFIGSFWPSMLAAFVVTVLIGYTTWHLFEKRCMQQVGRFSGFLREGYNGFAGKLARKPA